MHFLSKYSFLVSVSVLSASEMPALTEETSDVVSSASVPVPPVAIAAPTPEKQSWGAWLGSFVWSSPKKEEAQVAAQTPPQAPQSTPNNGSMAEEDQCLWTQMPLRSDNEGAVGDEDTDSDSEVETTISKVILSAKDPVTQEEQAALEEAGALAILYGLVEPQSEGMFVEKPEEEKVLKPGSERVLQDFSERVPRSKKRRHKR